MQFTSIILLTCFLLSIGLLAPGIKAAEEEDSDFCGEATDFRVIRATIEVEETPEKVRQGSSQTRAAVSVPTCKAYKYTAWFAIKVVIIPPNGPNIIKICYGQVPSTYCYGSCGISYFWISAHSGIEYEYCRCCKATKIQTVTQTVPLNCGCITIPNYSHTYKRPVSCSCQPC